MAVTDDLQAIAVRANRELDAAHDYFEHSNFVWKSFKNFVGAGNQIISENVATGTTIDQDGLLAQSHRYTREYLTTLTFRHFISVFEVFVQSFLHRLLMHNPRQFGKCQLDFDMVLSATSRDEVISFILARQINDLMYGTPRDWFEAVNKAVKLNCPTDEQLASLAEIKATRDILEHSAGVVNEIYLRKTGNKARYALGEKIEIDYPYHLASWTLLKQIVADLTEAAIGKLR